MKIRARLAGAAALLLLSGCCTRRLLPVMQEVVSVSLPIERYRLDNGLEVILHEDHRSPVAAVNLWYHVGAKDEPAHRNGFAHLFEHLMFQGSRNVAKGEYMTLLGRAGAVERNGTTNDDRTEYYETLPAERLDFALWLESDRMGSLLDRLDQANFEREREVVKNERRQNYENVAYGFVPLFIREALYPEGHPYHHAAIGTPEDLDGATLDDVRAFWRRFYRPDNATLVVAGDIDRPATRALIARYFGGIARGAELHPAQPVQPYSLDRERRLVVAAAVELPRVVITWPTPPAHTPGDAELELAAGVLQQRLGRELGGLRQWTQGVGVRHEQGQLGGRFEIVLSLRPGVSPEKALRVVDDELEFLTTHPLKGQLVRDAKAAQQSALLFAMERVTARARQFNTYNQLTQDPAFVSRDIEIRRRTGAAEIAQAIGAHLLAKKRVVTLVKTDETAPRCGRLVESK